MTLEKEKVLYKTTIVSFSDVWRGRNATRSILHVIKNPGINKLTKTYPSLRVSGQYYHLQFSFSNECEMFSP